MQKQNIKIRCLIMLLVLAILTPCQSWSVYAKNKPIVKLTKKTIKFYYGKKKTIRLKGVSTKKKTKVKWKVASGKKNVKIKTKGKRKEKLIIYGKKAGKAVITARYQKKTYRCRITVKKKHNSDDEDWDEDEEDEEEEEDLEDMEEDDEDQPEPIDYHIYAGYDEFSKCLMFSHNMYDITAQQSFGDISEQCRTWTTQEQVPWSDDTYTTVMIKTDIHPKNTAYWFSGKTIRKVIGWENLCTEETTNMEGTFCDTTLWDSDIILSFNTSKVMNMKKMFAGTVIPRSEDQENESEDDDAYHYGRLTFAVNPDEEEPDDEEEKPIPVFDTSQVTNMEEMFHDAKIGEITLGDNFHTEKVTSMKQMFDNCADITHLELGSNFDTGNCRNFQAMFAECTRLKYLDIGMHFKIKTGSNISQMLQDAGKEPPERISADSKTVKKKSVNITPIFMLPFEEFDETVMKNESLCNNIVTGCRDDTIIVTPNASVQTWFMSLNQEWTKNNVL